MVSVRQIIDLTFAFSLSVGVGVIAILSPLVDRTPYWNVPVIVGFLTSIAVAVVIAIRREPASSATVWKYSGVTFVLFALIGFVLDLGIQVEKAHRGQLY